MNNPYRNLVFGLLGGTLLCNSSLAQEPTATDYAMLPALENSRPDEAVLLDVVDTGEHLVAVGARGLVTLSEDAGESWQQAAVPVSLTLTSVFFADPMHGWATGHEGLIIATNDGGQNWQVQQTGRDTLVQSVPMLKADIETMRAQLDATEDAEQKDVIAFDLEYLEFALEDAELALETGPSEPMLDIWFGDVNNGIAVGAYGNALRTTDGGEHWQVISRTLDNPDKMHLNSVTSAGDGTIYIAGEAGLAFRSEDGGISWTKLDVPYQGSLFGVIAEGDSLLLHGLRGNIFVSQDRGDSWVPVDTGITTALVGGMRVNGGLVLVGTSGTVLEGNTDSTAFEYRFHPGRSTLSAVLPLSDSAVLLVGTDGAIKLESINDLESE